MSEMPIPRYAGDATPKTTPGTPSPRISGDGRGRGDAPSNPPQMSEMSVPDASPRHPGTEGCANPSPESVPPVRGTDGTGRPVRREGHR